MITGQPQPTQHRTVQSRPEILVTTPVLMEQAVSDPVTAQSACSETESIVVVAAAQCLDDGFGEMITSIHRRCGGTAQNGPKMIISAKSTSPALDHFVESLIPKVLPSQSERGVFRLIMAPEDAPRNEKKSDFLPKSNDEALDDEIVENTLAIQERLRRKQRLLWSLKESLSKWKYAESMATATALAQGSYHQQFNKKESSNLSAKLARMDSKSRFMGQRATALLESVELKHFEAENKRLREELEESRAAMRLLEDDAVTLSQALNLKVARIRQIEEERGAVIGELRASLEGMANEHRTMRAQMKEERLLLTDQLKRDILRLCDENERLRRNEVPTL